MKIPLAAWLSSTQWRLTLRDDVLAGIVVGIVLIPQSLGYALLAGLPPVYGLYATIVPVLIYALVGSSNTQAIGAVAITSIMTAQALAPFAQGQPSRYIALAALMALVVGIILLVAALLKLGWIMRFISRGVMAAFITGAAILIITGQVKYVFGLHSRGDTFPQLLWGFWQQKNDINLVTLLLGLSATLVLWLNRRYMTLLLVKFKLSSITANITAKLVPIGVIFLASLVVYQWSLASRGVSIVGAIPAGLPTFALPVLAEHSQWLTLLSSALLIALIAFISSASVAKSVALQRQESFDANSELFGLGLANISGAFFQGLPIAGGFSRTAVNIEAGAKTPLAGIVSAIIVMLVLLLASAWFYYLPLAVLGAGVIVAVSNLIDLRTLKMAWRSDKTEALAYVLTLLGVLLAGLQIGLVIGFMWSLLALIWRSNQPHVAVVGQLGQTAEFRNIERHHVKTWPKLLLLRIDENLFFGNSDKVASRVWQEVDKRPELADVVLIFSAINHVDLSSQWMLKNVEQQLLARNIQLHFAEIKGFVMDKLINTPLIEEWHGKIFATTEQAVAALTPSPCEPEYNL